MPRCEVGDGTLTGAAAAPAYPVSARARLAHAGCLTQRPLAINLAETGHAGAAAAPVTPSPSPASAGVRCWSRIDEE